MVSRFTWMDGRLVETDAATVPFLTAGFHYGIAVFEGIRAYQTPAGPAVFRLREHLERFEASARILGFVDLPYSIAELTDATSATVRANGFGDCYIRPLLWLGDGGWNLTLDTGRPMVAIGVWEQAVYLGEAPDEQGMTACVSSFMRHHPAAMMTKAKISGNYVNSYLAKTDAQRQGFDEAILLDPQGYVTECTGANVCLVRRGRLVTPPSDNILEGITRDSVMAMAGDLGIEVVEQRVSRDHLYMADEVFVCGTAAEIVGIAAIDGRPIGSGRSGPVTRRLQDAYRAAVHGDHPRSAGWLHYVSRVSSNV